MRRGCLVAFVILVSLWVLALPAAAPAATFTVDNKGNGGDAHPGNGRCSDAASHCTLRAAVEESNALAGADSVGFRPGLQNADKTIAVSASPIDISEQLTINGCNGRHYAKKPCVGVDLNGLHFGVLAPGVAVRGLALTDSGPVALDVASGSNRFQAQNDWFGLAIDGGEATNGTGIGLHANSATIGGNAREARNVFANAPAVHIESGDRNSIAGNFIGVKPGGTTPDGSTTTYAIRVEGVGGNPAVGNVIGGVPSKRRARTRACDGPCNLIDGASSSSPAAGIDLGGGLGTEPAQDTRVAANFIGLDATGKTAGPGFYNLTGIQGGDAQGTVIGGGDRARNVIAYQEYGVSDVSGSLRVKGNFIGLNSAGTARRTDPGTPGTGALVFSGPAGPAVVRGNRFAGDSDDGPLVLSGTPGGIAIGNRVGIGARGSDVGGGSYGIEINGGGSGWTVGGIHPRAANFVGNTADAAVAITGGDLNTVIGNVIGADLSGAGQSNDGAGILLTDGGGTVDGNRIGGDSNASENVISLTARDAIAMTGTGQGNVFARNAGQGNGAGPNDLFVDLGADGPDSPGSSNGGILAPQITIATSVKVRGTADPGTLVRVFLTKVPDGTNPNQIESFVASTTTKPNGVWVVKELALPTNFRVTASQTEATKGTSELSVAKTY